MPSSEQFQDRFNGKWSNNINPSGIIIYTFNKLAFVIYTTKNLYNGMIVTDIINTPTKIEFKNRKTKNVRIFI